MHIKHYFFSCILLLSNIYYTYAMNHTMSLQEQLFKAIEECKDKVQDTDPTIENALLMPIIEALQNGVNINAIDNRGETALYKAVALGRRAVVRTFKSFDGLDITTSNKKGVTALLKAIKKGHYNILHELFDDNISLVNQADIRYYSPLQWAITTAYEHEINTQLPKNATDAERTLYFEYLRMIPIRTISTVVRKEPLHKMRIIIALINRGADVNYQTDKGVTALHLAAFINDKTLLEYLISRGANPTLQNNRGETPLDIAYNMYHYCSAYKTAIDILSWHTQPIVDK